jgi:hypothetical protein
MTQPQFNPKDFLQLMLKRADQIWNDYQESHDPNILQQYINLIGEIRKATKDWYLTKEQRKLYRLKVKSMQAKLPDKAGKSTPSLQLTFSPTIVEVMKNDKTSSRD